MKRLQIYIDETVDRRVAEIANRRSVSKAELIRGYIEEGMRLAPTPDRDPLIAEVGTSKVAGVSARKAEELLYRW